MSVCTKHEDVIGMGTFLQPRHLVYVLHEPDARMPLLRAWARAILNHQTALEGTLEGSAWGLGEVYRVFLHELLSQRDEHQWYVFFVFAILVYVVTCRTAVINLVDNAFVQQEVAPMLVNIVHGKMLVTGQDCTPANTAQTSVPALVFEAIHRFHHLRVFEHICHGVHLQ